MTPPGLGADAVLQTGNFILRSTLTSPFGRKVRMAIEVLGLGHRIERQDASTQDPQDTLLQQNPLGKLPCLLLPDRTPIFDSRVIIEFLQEVAGTDRLLPRAGLARYNALTRAALADGITDAALLIVYESRFRPAEMPKSEEWLDRQRGKISRALDAFVAAPPDPGRTDLVSITFSCALGYMDWRKQVDWRASHPPLADWLAAFAAHEPAFLATRAEKPS